MNNQKDHHHFHIPVMGLAFTIDTPVKVAHLGISSVISIVQDNLIEKMRTYYYEQIREDYVPIKTGEADFRARRITDYLNLIKRLVDGKVEKLRTSPFGVGADIDRYFELLPDTSTIKESYHRMCRMEEGIDKRAIQDELRAQIRAGSIDVNIMTKLDKNAHDANCEEITDGSDAVAALRGFAKSELSDSTVVLSAGMNPRLFAYMEKLDAFNADSSGVFQKKIAVKVSDYRSALIQGKMLAKKGLWVSEFRIESGLNCGGHAFATDGLLLGPILEEFKNNREELKSSLSEIYLQACLGRGLVNAPSSLNLKITVQGGIGSHEENQLLLQHYQVDSTGWGTPFLLVPEATTVDEATLKSLATAGEEDVVLSHNSPLGVRFHYLKGSSAEKEKLERIAKGKPGSPCTEKYLVSNNEFGGEMICTASRAYQKKKLESLKLDDLDQEAYQIQKQRVLDKECLCVGLSNAAVLENSLEPFKNRQATNICPGPNIAYFSDVVSLKTMIDHIYGRCNVLKGQRPHMFLKELSLYSDYWNELLEDKNALLSTRQIKYVRKFHENLIEGINYYRQLSGQLKNKFSELSTEMDEKLTEVEHKLNQWSELKLV